MKITMILGAGSVAVAAVFAVPAVCRWRSRHRRSTRPSSTATSLRRSKVRQPEWEKRIEQDETQKMCSEYKRQAAGGDCAKVTAREKATVVFPADGNVLGDWKNGEKIAQDGRGGQFSDGRTTPTGGNCYACHQMAPRPS